jgi:uncharacterized oligopeptide transporter (OPT) family protein
LLFNIFVTFDPFVDVFLVLKGNGRLPENSGIFMLLFAILFGATAALKTYAVRRELSFARYIPSGIAFAIGFLNPPSFSIARLIGGVIELLWNTYHSRSGKEAAGGGITLIVIASGFVLGEGVVSVVSLVLKTYGVGVVSCWGCGHGLCSGC